MTVIGVDSSGKVKQPPIWFVATKFNSKQKQKHTIVKISTAYHKRFVGCTENWAEKLSAVLIFETLTSKRLISEVDSVVIDPDWESRNAQVMRYLRTLFGIYFPRRSLKDSDICFISDRENEDVRHAHNKTHKAKWGRYEHDLIRDPPLTSYLDSISRQPIRRGP